MRPAPSKDLTSLEHAVLDKLLAGDHRVLEGFRGQLRRTLVKSREFSGKGFFTELVQPSSEPAVAMPARVRFGDVIAELEGSNLGAGFVLFIDGGRMTMLEGYVFDGAWPWGEPRIRELRYEREPRDLTKLVEQ